MYKFKNWDTNESLRNNRANQKNFCLKARESVGDR